MKLPDYPFVAQFRNTHKGRPIVVMGLGQSTSSLPQEWYANHLTIGVNDIARYHTPTYTVVIDKPDGLDKHLPDNPRSRYVRKAYITGSCLMMSYPKYWTDLIPDADKSHMVWQLGSNPPWSWNDDRRTTDPPDYTRHFSGKGMPRGPMMPQWCCSPHLAIHFAAFLGASAIGMIGVDMSPDRFFETTDTPHGLEPHVYDMNVIFGNTVKALHEELNIPLYNLSDISRITSVPYLAPNEFPCPTPSASS